MGLEAHFDFDGEKRLRKSLDRVLASGKSPRPVLTAFGTHMATIGARSLDSQSDPVSGRRWQKPRPGTLGIRPGGGGGGKALYDTGRLARSLTRRPRVAENSVTVGSNLAQARLLQFGGTVVPKRAKHLTQPLTREAARTQSFRRWWTEMERKNRRPFILRRRGKVLAMALAKPAKRRSGAGSGRARAEVPKVEAHWKLVAKMTVPARPFLGFSPSSKRLLNDLLRSELSNAYRSDQGGA